MDLKELDLMARQIAKDYRRLEQQLLGLVVQIDQNKIFYKLGFNSLFNYLTDGLELSPAIASAFINVARKAHEVPELKQQVESGKLSIYKAQRITSVLTPENSSTWLALAEQKSHRELEREVAMSSPQNAIRERSRYVSLFKEPKERVTVKRDIPRIELNLGVSEKLMLKIRRAQDLESQRKKKSLNLEQTLEEVLLVYLGKRDPLEKAYRQKAKGKLQLIPTKKCGMVGDNHATVRRKTQDAGVDDDAAFVEQGGSLNKGQRSKQKRLKSGDEPEATLSHCCSMDRNHARAKIVAERRGEKRSMSLIKNLNGVDNRLTFEGVENSQLEGQLKISRIEQCCDVDKNRARANTERSEVSGELAKVSANQRCRIGKDPSGAIAKKREAIPSHLRHQLQIRDNSQCGYVDNAGMKCPSKRFLEIHHIKPVSQGGENSLENLILLCSGHHKAIHHRLKIRID